MACSAPSPWGTKVDSDLSHYYCIVRDRSHWGRRMHSSRKRVVRCSGRLSCHARPPPHTSLPCTSPAMQTPHHACPLPCMPLPHMSPAIHAPVMHIPPATHAPCHSWTCSTTVVDGNNNIHKFCRHELFAWFPMFLFTLGDNNFVVINGYCNHTWWQNRFPY